MGHAIIPFVQARLVRVISRPAILPLLLCLLVMGLYAAVFTARVAQPGGALAFAVLGTSNTPGNRGYDGQYYYRIAVSPLGGRHGLDRPAYRYQRIGYPLLARALALGQRARIAGALALATILAIGLGTFCLGLLLRRNGASPLYSLVYAAYAGQVASFWRDLAEPVSCGLAALALAIYRPRRVWPAGLTLLAAALTKETALLFALPLAGHLLLRGDWRAALRILALTVLPYAVWQLALWLIFGQTGVGGADRPPLLPFGGLAGVRGDRQFLSDLAAIVVPAILCLGLLGIGMLHAWRAVFGASFWRRCLWVAGDFPSLLVLANLAFVIWLPARSYADLWASARNADGLVLAALAHPALGATRLRLPLAVLWALNAPLLWLQ